MPVNKPSTTKKPTKRTLVVRKAQKPFAARAKAKVKSPRRQALSDGLRALGEAAREAQKVSSETMAIKINTLG